MLEEIVNTYRREKKQMSPHEDALRRPLINQQLQEHFDASLLKKSRPQGSQPLAPQSRGETRSGGRSRRKIGNYDTAVHFSVSVRTQKFDCEHPVLPSHANHFLPYAFRRLITFTLSSSLFPTTFARPSLSSDRSQVSRFSASTRQARGATARPKSCYMKSCYMLTDRS